MRARRSPGPAGIVFAVDELGPRRSRCSTTAPRGRAGSPTSSRRRARTGRRDRALRDPLGRQGLPRDPRHAAEGHRPDLREPVGAGCGADRQAAAGRRPRCSDDRAGRPVRAGRLHRGLGRRGRGQLRHVPGAGSEKVPSATAFAEAFEAEYGPVSSYGPLAYEATNIILSSIEKVGKLDRAAIRDAVRATENYTAFSAFRSPSTTRATCSAPRSTSTRSRGWGSSRWAPSARSRASPTARRAMALLEACRTVEALRRSAGLSRHRPHPRRARSSA